MSWTRLSHVLAQADVAEPCVDFEDGSVALCEAIAAVVPSSFVARTLATMLPSLARILLIIVVAALVNRVARRLIKKFVIGLTEKGIERLGSIRTRAPLADTRPLNLQRATMRTETIGGVLRSLATAMIWAVALLMVLGEIGVNLGPLIAGAGIVGIALGFGSQRLVQDFLSGIFMLLEDQYGVGDIVDVGVASGTIEGISLRTTRLRAIDGVVWHVPNGEIHRVGNMSQLWSRALLDVSVSYSTDLDHATAVIERVALDLHADEHWKQDFVAEPEVWGVQEFGDSDVKLRLVVKVVPARQWAIERELRARLKKTFDAEGIEIPFPQRVVWMRHEDGDGLRDDGKDSGKPARSRTRQGPDDDWGPPVS